MAQIANCSVCYECHGKTYLKIVQVPKSVFQYNNPARIESFIREKLEHECASTPTLLNISVLGYFEY